MMAKVTKKQVPKVHENRFICKGSVKRVRFLLNAQTNGVARKKVSRAITIHIQDAYFGSLFWMAILAIRLILVVKH